ncbi:DUF4271 domain-containing protein [Psychroflexus tropicus]|uniref:DUF4271 domain-containing protein n=1 Tax=Psychroflexus tropicus TaxID=197345 RepID=UPI0003A13C39|nr:DUF4271 domain-containing protein [Psychroflexus tropicus]
MFQSLRPHIDHHWTVATFFFVLIILVVVKWNKTSYFFSYLNSLYTSNFYSKKFLEKRRIELSEVLLFIGSLFGLSYFIMIITESLDFSILTHLQILFLISIFVLSKYLVEKMLGDLFEIDQILNKYLFYKQGVLSWLALFFLFPAGLFLYFQGSYSPIIVLGIVTVAVLVYAFKLFSFVGLYQKHILAYWFYFILYLCAFEIAPYLILFKVLKIN